MSVAVWIVREGGKSVQVKDLLAPRRFCSDCGHEEILVIEEGHNNAEPIRIRWKCPKCEIYCPVEIGPLGECN